MLSLNNATVPELHAAMEANLVTHMTWVQARLPGARVVEAPDLLLIDSGFPNDTFNLICRARLAPETLPARIAEAIAFFEQVGRPFSWWVGPSDQPDDLGQALSQAGLSPAETELGMAAALPDLPPVETAPQGLRIERVTQPHQVTDFAGVCFNGAETAPIILAYYTAATPLLLRPDCPLRFYVGYLDNHPVASAELCVGGGVAGLYSICTLESERRKGFGTALTVQPLLDARTEGIQTAILQASPQGQSVYARVGFRPSGWYTEYKRG